MPLIPTPNKLPAEPAEDILTERERLIFDFIVDYKKKNDGNSPVIRDVIEGTGIPSTSNISYYFMRLQIKGFVNLYPEKSRGIKVIGGEWTYKKPN